MANFSVPAPYEPEKSGAYLHDRSRLPAGPGDRNADMRYLLVPLLAIAFGIGLFALCVQTRAAWDTHRDWVVPASAQVAVLGGLGLGYLLARNKWLEALPGIGLLLIAVVITALNIWRGEVVSGSDALRYAMGIVTTVFIGLTVIALVGGLIAAEVTDPTRPPEPEV